MDMEYNQVYSIQVFIELLLISDVGLPHDKRSVFGDWCLIPKNQCSAGGRNLL